MLNDQQAATEDKMAANISYVMVTVAETLAPRMGETVEDLLEMYRDESCIQALYMTYLACRTEGKNELDALTETARWLINTTRHAATESDEYVAALVKSIHS